MSLQGLSGDFGFHYWGADVFRGAMRPPGVGRGGGPAGVYVPHVDVFKVSAPAASPTYSRPVGRINPLSGARLRVAPRRELDTPEVSAKRPIAAKPEPTEVRPAKAIAAKSGSAEGDVHRSHHSKRSNHATSTVETLVKRRPVTPAPVEEPTDDGGSDTEVPEDIVPVDPPDESGDGGSDSPPGDDPTPEDGGGGDGESEPPDGPPIDDPSGETGDPEDPGIDPPPIDPPPVDPAPDEPPEGEGSDPEVPGEEGSGDPGEGSGDPGEDPPSDPPADPPPEDDGGGEPPEEEPPAEEPPAEDPPGEEPPPEDEPPIDIEA